MGIVVAPLVILGLVIAWWVSSQLGGWLSFLLSEERVAQAMAVGMRSVVIITVLSAVIGLVIGSFLTWLLTRPILEMTQVARRVKNGDLSVRATIWADDEVGELGYAFNDMIISLSTSQHELKHFNEQLTHRNRELAVLYRLADMANQPYNVQQVSVDGLNQTIESANAFAGLILLQTDGQPNIAASHNLSNTFLDSLLSTLPELRILSHEHTEFFEPQIFYVDQEPNPLPADLRLEFRRCKFSAWVYAPIAVKQNLLGALLLFYQDRSSITAQHSQLLSAICNQLGVTIQNSQLWEELKYKENIRAHLLNKVVSAQEEERQRISRELHDETGQALTSLLVQLKILEQAENFTDVHTQVNDIRQLALRTLQEVRRLAMDLRPAALDDLGLVSALEGYIYNYAAKTNINVDFQSADLETMRLPHDIEVVLYRVIQEALTNIARHANATHVTVLIRRDRDELEIIVEDNGCGFDVAAILKSNDRGLGILGMQERIQLIGGHLKLSSIPQKGTRICVNLTLEQNIVWEGS
jgi:signal transduction histidine kinase